MYENLDNKLSRVLKFCLLNLKILLAIKSLMTLNKYNQSAFERCENSKSFVQSQRERSLEPEVLHSKTEFDCAQNVIES